MPPRGLVPIVFERHVQQIVDDLKYRGYIAFGGTYLDYEVEFPNGISAAQKARPATVEQLKETCLLRLTRSGRELQLSSEEYHLFSLLVGSIVYRLVRAPQIADTARGVANMITGRLILIRSALSMTLTEELELSGSERAVLKAAHFGARIP